MQIENIILYGIEGEIRPLSFRLGAMNIITGKSRTGKTALLDIIDYCLGRGTCNVPAGRIRNSVSWFALKLRFSSCEVFVARRNPAPRATTSSDVYFRIGSNIPIPPVDTLTPTITVDGLIQELDRLLGIAPNENVPTHGQSRRPLRATVEHAKFLVFQGQSEIASREFLFHRQGEPFIPQAIKDTLPFFLGTVSDDSLLLRAEQRDARRDLLQLERQQAEIDRLVRAGSLRAQALLSEAAEVGLVEGTSEGDALETLRALTRIVTRPPEDSVEVGRESVRLREEQTELRRHYQLLREELDAARLFNSAQGSFRDEARDQAARLETVDLLSDTDASNVECPLCRSHLETPVPAVAEMAASLKTLRDELQNVGDQRPRVDEHIGAIQERMTDVRERLTASRAQLQAIEVQSELFQRARDLHGRQLHVLGRISLYLENIPLVQVDSSLGLRIQRLRDRLKGLDERLQVDLIREAVDSALNQLGRWMTEGAEALQLEYSPNPHRLDLSQLTVIADSYPRPTRMSQMGSAENWLGCHLITHMALHRWFVAHERPVPRFLFIDQPTSAYYPPDRVGSETDEDRLAVTRLYRWLAEVVTNQLPGFQLIVVDHADLDDPIFSGAVVEKWRGDAALIPADWPTLSTEPSD
jgi:hypothetical protein